MNKRKTFPVLHGYSSRAGIPKSVPWSLIEGHRRQAAVNHGDQTLERLAERGGLSPRELWHVVTDTCFDFACRKPDHEILAWLRAGAGLTTDGARELAQRRARHEAALRVASPIVRVVVADILTRAERERLFAWMREELLQVAPIDAWVECEKRDAAGWIAELLGIDDADAMALLEAAGWSELPDPVPTELST